MMDSKDICHSEGSCGSCKQSQLVSQVFCHDCELYLCHECVDSHKQFDPYKQHNLSTMVNLEEHHLTPTTRLQQHCAKLLEKDTTKQEQSDHETSNVNQQKTVLQSPTSPQLTNEQTNFEEHYATPTTQLQQHCTKHLDQDTMEQDQSDHENTKTNQQKPVLHSRSSKPLKDKQTNLEEHCSTPTTQLQQHCAKHLDQDTVEQQQSDHETSNKNWQKEVLHSPTSPQLTDKHTILEEHCSTPTIQLQQHCAKHLDQDTIVQEQNNHKTDKQTNVEEHCSTQTTQPQQHGANHLEQDSTKQDECNCETANTSKFPQNQEKSVCHSLKLLLVTDKKQIDPTQGTIQVGVDEPHFYLERRVIVQTMDTAGQQMTIGGAQVDAMQVGYGPCNVLDKNNGTYVFEYNINYGKLHVKINGTPMTGSPFVSEC